MVCKTAQLNIMTQPLTVSLIAANFKQIGIAKQDNQCLLK